MEDDVRRVITIINEEGMTFDSVLLAALSAADADEAATLLKAFPNLWDDVKPEEK